MIRLESGGIAVLIAAAALVPVAAWGSFEREGGGRGPAAPPPEAYEACVGKEAGGTVQMSMPRGETMTATCRDVGGRLVAVPDAGSKGAPVRGERQGSQGAPAGNGGSPSSE